MSQDNCGKYCESDNDSCDTVRCFQESEDEFAAPTRAVLEEEEEARREREARGFSVPTGVLSGADEEEGEVRMKKKVMKKEDSPLMSSLVTMKKKKKSFMTLRSIKKKTRKTSTMKQNSTRMYPLFQMISLPVLICLLTWKFLVVLMESQSSR